MEADESVIGERDAIDVAGEIERGLLPGTDLLHVHIPRLRPDAGIDLPGEPSSSQSVPHAGAEDGRECISWHEEAWMCGTHPCGSISGKTARADEQVRVRVKVERA